MTKLQEGEAASDVYEAEQVYLLMTKDHRISRNIRAKWYLDHINTVLHYSDPDADTGKPKVISVLRRKSGTWNESSSPCKVTANTVVNFLSTHHALVFAFDISPSTTCSAASTNDVILECMFEAFRNCVTGLTKPFNIPGSSCTLTPYLYVTVIAYSPLINCPVRQVLLHGYLVTSETVHHFLELVYNELDRFENEVACFVDKLHKENDGDFGEPSCDGRLLSRMHMPADVAFFNLLKNAMLAIQLLPDNCNAGIIVVTDGVIGVPDVGRCDSLYTQLITQSCTCSFIEVSSRDWLQTGLGHVPHSELLKFFASATFGAYYSESPDVSKDDNSKVMNIYHEGILCWSFQKSTDGFHSQTDKRMPDFVLCRGGKNLQKIERSIEKLPAWTLATSLLSVVSSRLKDGFSIKGVSFDGAQGEGNITVNMVLPWKQDVNIRYSAKTSWPLDYCDKKLVHVVVTYEGPYQFIHDLTCNGGFGGKLKSKAPSAIRKAVNVKFVRILNSIKAADVILEQMQKFATEKANSTVPEYVRSGVAVFALGSESKSTDDVISISSRDSSVVSFASFWKPLIDMDMKSSMDHKKPSELSSYTMEKWFHIHRINLVLEHDMPLPQFLHQPNKAGKYSSIECRPAFTSLCSLFSKWSTFVLISEQYYVKFISADGGEGECKLSPAADASPSSFCFIRMIAKPPYVTLRLNFLGGTSTKDRNQMIDQLKDELSKLHFPKRALGQAVEHKSGRHRSSAVHSQGASSASAVSALSHERKPPLQRDWSEVTCCVLLSKPVDRILVRYERVPNNITTLDHIWNSTAGGDTVTNGMSVPGQYMTSSHLARINSYLHHQRWIWNLHLDGFRALDVNDVSKILSIITKLRLQEGFHFAHSQAGMTSMILEVDMKNESSANADIELQAEASSSSVIQYVTFPPQTVRHRDSNAADSDSEDESASLPDANLRLVTECWIEPQFGVVQNSAPEREPFEGCVFSELPQKIFPVDHGCITSLVTFEHLLRFCERPAGSRIRNGAGSSRDRPLRDSAEHDEPRVKNIPFMFDVMSLLPKCQQVELLFCTYAPADHSLRDQTEDANNILLHTLIDELSRSSNEIELSHSDCVTFVQHVNARRSDIAPVTERAASTPLNLDAWAQPPPTIVSAVASEDSAHLLPIRLRSATATPTAQLGTSAAMAGPRAFSGSPFAALERADQSQYDTDTSGAMAACTPPPSTLPTLSPPRWRCFAKRSAPTRFALPQPLGGAQEKGNSELADTAVLTLIPETYSDLQKLLAPSEKAAGLQGPTAAARDLAGASGSPHASECHQSAGKSSASAATAILPVYVYYCTYTSLTERLVNRWSAAGMDIFEDFRFVTEQPKPGLSGREHRSSQCSGTSGEDDGHRRRSRTFSSGASLFERSMSGETYGEESELQAHCRRLRDLYYRSFISGLYQSLQQGYVMASCDVEAAITSICEEESTPVEINLTEFLRMTCAHYQWATSANPADQGLASRASGVLVPAVSSSAFQSSLAMQLENQKKNVTFDIFGSSLPQEMMCSSGLPGPAPAANATAGAIGSTHFSPTEQIAEQSSAVRPLALNRLLAVAGPSPATEHAAACELCGTDVKRKFAELFSSWFRPIPSCPDYYYFCAQPVTQKKPAIAASSFMQNAKSTKGEPNGDLEDDDIVAIASTACSDTTESDELFDLTPHEKNAVSGHGRTTVRRPFCRSFSSSQGSELVSDDATSASRAQAAFPKTQDPLFVQLVCSVRSERKSHVGSPAPVTFFEQVPVSSIPTCFCELQECFSDNEDVQLSSLTVTLDMVCVKLPADYSDEEERVRHSESLRESIVAQTPNDDEDYDNDEDIEQADTSLDSKPSSDAAAASGTLGLSLPRAQKNAIVRCKTEIEWLIDDEIASALRQLPVVKPETLRIVVDHVKQSAGKPSCLMQQIPLDFVYGHEQSLHQFIKDFEKVSPSGYRLMKAGDYYYLVCVGRRVPSVASMQPGGFVPVDDSSVVDPSPSAASDGDVLHTTFGDEGNVRPAESALTAGDPMAGEETYGTTARPIRIHSLGESCQVLEEPTRVPGGQSSPKKVIDTIAHAAHSLEDLPQRDRINEWARDSGDSQMAVTQFGSLPRSYSELNVQQHIPGLMGGELHGCELRVGSELRRVASTSHHKDLPGARTEEEIGLDIPRKTRHVSDGDAIRKRASFAMTILSPAQNREFLAREMPSMPANYDSRSRHTTGSVSRPRTPLSGGGLYTDSVSGYDADLSDDENNDDSTCCSGFSRKTMQLPNFWLVLQVANDRVTVLFHCSSIGSKMGAQDSNCDMRYVRLYMDVIDEIKRLCKKVNQYLLLQKLYETRSCIDLLVPKDDDEILRGDEFSGTSAVSCKSTKDSDSDEDDRTKQEYLAAKLNLTPGHFACGCVWQMQFYLHPRLKTGNTRSAVARATAAFMSVLGPLSVQNQRNMFVYKEKSGNVFYLRLDESPSLQCDPVGPKVEDEAFSSQLSGSRSSSIPSLYKLDRDDTESRVTQDALDTLSVSSRMASISRRGEEGVVLKVYGICEPGKDVTEGLNQALLTRLEERVLDELSTLLKKNPSCKLTADDVRFLQKSRSPTEEKTIAIPVQLSAYILPLVNFLRHNIKLPKLPTVVCFHPKYADTKPETHFRDFTQATAPEMCDEDTYIYNKQKGTQVSDKGSGIALVYMKLLDHRGIPVKPSISPSTDPDAYKQLESCAFDALTATHIVGKDKQTWLSAGVASHIFSGAGRASPAPQPSNSEFYIRFSVWTLCLESDVLLHESRGHLVRALKHALSDVVTQYFLLTAAPLCVTVAEASTRDEGPTTPSHLLEEPKTPTRHADLMRAESLHDDLADAGMHRRAQNIAFIGRGARRRSAFSLFDSLKGQTTSPTSKETLVTSVSFPSAFDDTADDAQTKPEVGAWDDDDEELPVLFVDMLINWFEYYFTHVLGVSEFKSPSCKQTCSLLSECLSKPVMFELHDAFARQLTPNAAVKMFCLEGARYMPHDASSSVPPSIVSNVSASGESSGQMPAYVLLVYNCATSSYRQPFEGNVAGSAVADGNLKGSKSSLRFPPVAQYSSSYTTESTPAATGAVAQTPATAAAAGTSSPSALCMLPRQQLIVVFVRNKQVQMYIYNWTDESKSKQISAAVSRIVQWSNARLHTLDCVAMHKAGLFHLASFAAPAIAIVARELAPRGMSSVKDELRATDIEWLITNPRCAILDQLPIVNAVPTARLQQPSVASRQSQAAQRESSIGAEHALPAAVLDDVYRNSGRQARPLQSFTSTDLLQQHGSQLLALHETAMKDREHRSKLLRLHQDLLSGNNTILDAVLHLLKESSRIVHIVTTPLLFSPHWRKKAMQQLVQGRKDLPAVLQLQRTPAPDTNSSGSGRSRHSSGASAKVPTAAVPARGDSPLPRVGSSVATAESALRPYEEKGWHHEVQQHFMNKYIEYMRQPHSSRENHGFSLLTISTGLSTSKPSNSAAGIRKPQPRHHTAAPTKEGGSPTAAAAAAAAADTVPSHSGDVRYLQKTTSSGTFLMELSFEDVFFCVKLYVCNAVHSTGDSRDATPLFIDTCDRMRDHTHCHSFAHDFHLRMMHKHVRGQPCMFNSSYHVTNFLQDFKRFHAWAPRYARNLLKAGSVEVSNTGNVPHQLYDYIVNNKDDYSLRTLNMVEHDHAVQTCERALVYDYTLSPAAVDMGGQASSRHRSGELEVAVIISHDIDGSLNLDLPADTLLLKYYVVLINKTQHFPFKQHYVIEHAKHGGGGTASAQEMAQAELAEKLHVSTSSMHYSASPSTAWLATGAAASAVRGQVACLQSASAVGSSGSGSYTMGQQQLPYYALLDEQVALAKDKIKEIVRGASSGCRRDSLWSSLWSEPAVATDEEQLQYVRKRREMADSRENLVPKLTVAEFQELLHLVKKVPINAYDERLQTFANMPPGWYAGLKQALLRKYPDLVRQFQRESLHYLVVLVPQCEDVAMLLEMEPLSDVSLLLRMHARDAMQTHGNDVLMLPDEVNQFLEDFVNTMCYYMWLNMVAAS